jgi:hypothetical protein
VEASGDKCKSFVTNFIGLCHKSLTSGPRLEKQASVKIHTVGTTCQWEVNGTVAMDLKQRSQHACDRLERRNL